MRRCLGCMREYNEEYEVCPFCGYIYGTEAASRSHLPPGTVLQNRYLLGKVLGQGGFGITYIAWDQRLEKPVAIKEFFPTAFASRMTGQNEVSCFNAESRYYFESGLQKMMNESRLLARFTDQTNIVQVMDCIEGNGTAYIIMELLRGETVQCVLNRERKLSLDRTMQIILPILQALEVIHKTGLVHRDVSPDNIFVCEDGKVKLLDFGAARIATGQDNKTLSVMLKKGYAPIEQYSSHGKQGPFTDVYAVCATTYKMLTGVTPENSLDRMSQETMRPLTDFADVPAPVAKVIQRGMSVEAPDRIQTAGELYSRLQSALQAVERTDRKKQKAAKEKTTKEKPKKTVSPAQKAPAKAEAVPRAGKQSGAAGNKRGKSKTTRAVLIAASALVLVAAIAVGSIFAAPWIKEFAERRKAVPLNENAAVGDVVSFGRYGIEGKHAKAISWIVLDRSEDEVLLLSKKGIDNQTYHGDSGKSYTWETSLIREWLNTDFYDAAFSDEEKAKIVLHENETPDNPIYGTYGGNDTTDRCFLLSMQEVEQYFPTQNERIAECTNAVFVRDYSKTGLGDKTVSWMLRSPGDDYWAACKNTTFMCVGANGTLWAEINGLQYDAVRPAVWVNVKGESGDADTEWISGYREHLYDFSYTLKDGVLHLSGEGVMPEMDTEEWDDTFRKSVKSVVIEEGFSTIADATCMDFTELTSVQIPQGVEEIGAFAFHNCPKLKTISLPSSVKRIGQSAFYQSGIASNQDYWEDGMMCIDHCLIRVSKSVTGNAVVPQNITVIGEFAFDECQISRAEIPYGVTELNHTFSGCTQLLSVDLPNSIVRINDAFNYCEALQKVQLPNRLERIESGFYDCESLEEIAFPQSLRYIGEQAFCCCWSLEAVTMYAGIERIADSAFFNCPSMRTVQFYGTQSDWDGIQIEDGNEALTDASIEFATAELSPFAGAQKGDTVLFGKYEQDDNTANGSEPVEWLVLSAADDGHRLLLLSQNVLDCRPYHPEYTDVTWETCEMRAYLNDSFYNTCFSVEEQAQIIPKSQTNPDNKSYNTRGGNDTTDAVWLLSLQQAQSLSPSVLAASPTAYAVAQGAFQSAENNGNAWWSLRTPGSGNNLCALVRSDGDIRAGGEKVHLAGGVRPAIWVSVP